MADDRMETARFFAHVPLLLNGGVPVEEAFTLFADDTASAALASALRDVSTALEDDASLHEAFAKHPALFPPPVIALLRVGEHAGLLDVAADRAAAELARAADKRTFESEVSLVLRVLGWMLTAGLPVEEAMPLLAGLATGKAAAEGLAGALAAIAAEKPLAEALGPLVAGLPEFIPAMLADAEEADAEEGTAARAAALCEGVASGLEQGWLPSQRAPRPLAQELRTVYHLLARFIGMGVPLAEAFPRIAAAAGREDVRGALAGVHAALGERATLAEALAAHPGVFTPAAVALLKHAEDGGSIPRVADALADAVDRGLFVPAKTP